jgi:TonB family protein
MTPEIERRHRIISGIATSIICILLLLIFWFYNFHYELAPVINDKGAVAVSLGDPNNGGPELVPIQAESAPSVPKLNMPESYEQTQDADAVAQKSSPEKTTNTPQNPNQTPQEDDLLSSLKTGKKNQKASASGDGPNFGAQGDPNGKQGGDPHGTLGGTGGGGIGTSHSFGVRKFYLGSGKNNCNEEGKVILEVTLMPDGRIRFDNVSPRSNGSDCLEKVAINYLRSSSFNAAENPISVEGTITFTFKLR